MSNLLISLGNEGGKRLIINQPVLAVLSWSSPGAALDARTPPLPSRHAQHRAKGPGGYPPALSSIPVRATPYLFSASTEGSEPKFDQGGLGNGVGGVRHGH